MQEAGTDTGLGPADSPRWARLTAWWAASVVVAVVHNGLWATPNIEFLSLIARNPGENPFTGALRGDYLLTDVSLTSLAALSGQTAPHAYARLHLVLLVVLWAAVVALAAARFGHRAARALTVLLAASPLVTVSMQWLGQPDPLTGMCGVAMVLVRRRWAVAALAVLAGLTHPEQALFMAAVAGVARTAMDSPDGDGAGLPAAPRGPVSRGAREVSVAVGGVVFGRVLTEAWFRAHDITITTPRTDFLSYGAEAYWRHHSQQPLGLLWTLWGPLWLAALAGTVALVLARRRARRQGRPEPKASTVLWATVALLAVAALVPVAVTLDETRVYAVLTAPLLGAAAVGLARDLPGAADRAVAIASAVLLGVTAVLPGGFATGVTSWRGRLDTPAAAVWLLRGDLPANAPGDVTSWLLGPFDFVIPAPPD
jgi:hypothetical protein